MPSTARLEIFFEKILKRVLKFINSLKLYTGPPNCITGASKSGVQGEGLGPQGPPGSASEWKHGTCQKFNILIRVSQSLLSLPQSLFC